MLIYFTKSHPIKGVNCQPDYRNLVPVKNNSRIWIPCNTQRLSPSLKGEIFTLLWSNAGVHFLSGLAKRQFKYFLGLWDVTKYHVFREQGQRFYWEKNHPHFILVNTLECRTSRESVLTWWLIHHKTPRVCRDLIKKCHACKGGERRRVM